MTSRNQLSADTALAMQQYRELRAILAEESIEATPSLLNSAKRNRAIYLLHSLQSYLEYLEKHFHNLNLESIPVVEFSSSQASFLSGELIPNAESIRRALWGSFGLKILAGETSDVLTSSVRFKSALNHLLDFWLNTLHEGEKEEYSEFIDTCSELREMVDGSWFDPDGWKTRQKMLRPVLLPTGTTDRLRDHIRIRLMEVYRAFVFGQFMSSVALCRTLLEFMLRRNAGRFDVSLKTDSRWEKSLSQLIEEIAERAPTLAEHSEAIRDKGNRVIHPEKRSVVAIPRILQDEALECIEHTVAVVEQLYGDKG
jgi:hypothetical protein